MAGGEPLLVDRSGDAVSNGLLGRLQAVDAARACKVDADCVTVDLSTDCQGACFDAVHADRKGEVERAIQAASREFCRGFRDDGCPYATPRCMAPAAACVEGSCQMQYH